MAFGVQKKVVQMAQEKKWHIDHNLGKKDHDFKEYSILYSEESQSLCPHFFICTHKVLFIESLNHIFYWFYHDIFFFLTTFSDSVRIATPLHGHQSWQAND